MQNILDRYGRWAKRAFDHLRLESNVHGNEGLRLRCGAPLVDRFGGLISVLFEDEERGLFLMNQGGSTPADTLARVIEINPALWCDSAMVKTVESLLVLDFPAKTTLAASLYASPCITPILRDYVESRDTQAMLVAAEPRRLLRHMAAAKAGLLHHCATKGHWQGHPTAARHFRVWLSITCRIGTAAVAQLARGEENETVTRFRTVCDAAEAALSQFGLFSHRWQRSHWHDTERELVNPHKALAGLLSTRTALATRAVREEVVDLDTSLDISRQSLTFSSPGVASASAVALAVTRLPASIHINDMAGLMGAADTAGAILTTPYLVTTLVEPTALVDDRSTVALKAARVKQLHLTDIGHYLADLPERNRDLEIAREACEKYGGLARVAMQMVIFGRPGEELSLAETGKAMLREAGLDGDLDVGLQAVDYLASLPGEGASALMRDLKNAHRTMTITRKAASHLLPALAEWRGSPAREGAQQATPMLLFVSRRGQVFGLDLFANRSGNYNALVCGKSGSGKSVLAQDLVLSLLAQGGRAWVFDIGHSYKHCARLISGQWLDFDTPGSVCLNPLDMVEDPADSIDELAQIVTVMANGDSALDATITEYVKEAILTVIERARSANGAASITDLCLELLSLAQDTGRAELSDLVTRLKPYCAGGRFGRWFEGKASVSFTESLVVLEMQSLSNKPQLQEAALLTLIMGILQEIRRLPRSQKKLVVIDEGWRLLTGNSGRFIEWACRTLRKYGAGIVCISQSLTDFEKTGTARAMRVNADTVFLLRQDDAAIALYSSDPWTQRQIRSLTTVSGVFSEVFIRQGDSPAAIGRLYLDPFARTAFSTSPRVFEEVEKQAALFGDLTAAIREVAAGERT